MKTSQLQRYRISLKNGVMMQLEQLDQVKKPSKLQIANEIELILADIVLRGDMDGIDAVDRISNRYDVPVYTSQPMQTMTHFQERK